MIPDPTRRELRRCIESLDEMAPVLGQMLRFLNHCMADPAPAGERIEIVPLARAIAALGRAQEEMITALIALVRCTCDEEAASPRPDAARAAEEERAP